MMRHCGARSSTTSTRSRSVWSLTRVLAWCALCCCVCLSCFCCCFSALMDVCIFFYRSCAGGAGDPVLLGGCDRPRPSLLSFKKKKKKKMHTYSSKTTRDKKKKKKKTHIRERRKTTTKQDKQTQQQSAHQASTRVNKDHTDLLRAVREGRGTRL